MSKYAVNETVLVNGTPATVVAEVKDHYVVKLRDDSLVIFDTDGVCTADDDLVMRKADSEVFRDGDKVFSKKFGVGYVKDHRGANFIVKFPEINDWWNYNSNGRYVSEEDNEEKAVHHLPDEYQFTFGDRVEVSNRGDFSDSVAGIFVHYDKDSADHYKVMLFKSYCVVNENFMYARHLDENEFIAKKCSM